MVLIETIWNLGLYWILWIMMPHLTQGVTCPVNANVVTMCQSDVKQAPSLYLDGMHSDGFTGSCTCRLQAVDGPINFTISAEAVPTNCQALLYSSSIGFVLKCDGPSPAPAFGSLQPGLGAFVTLVRQVKDEAVGLCVHLQQSGGDGQMKLTCLAQDINDILDKVTTTTTVPPPKDPPTTSRPPTSAPATTSKTSSSVSTSTDSPPTSSSVPNSTDSPTTSSSVVVTTAKPTTASPVLTSTEKPTTSSSMPNSTETPTTSSSVSNSTENPTTSSYVSNSTDKPTASSVPPTTNTSVTNASISTSTNKPPGNTSTSISSPPTNSSVLPNTETPVLPPTNTSSTTSSVSANTDNATTLSADGTSLKNTQHNRRGNGHKCIIYSRPGCSIHRWQHHRDSSRLVHSHCQRHKYTSQFLPRLISR
ncbi:mucin-5AC-like [Haliotis rubra]|uniref:mucin-5AC-like n=1 Tax=Haliotis rubra TaxID=36100 RepID=UPI001EE55F74|nr:mucin-5AC-like [Haliotis rubra]